MDTAESDEIRFFDLNSRIGRLRYLAYGLGIGLLSAVPLLLFYFIGLAAPAIGVALAGLTYIALVVFSWGFMVRRLHDIDMSGWWSLLAFVPIGNLVLLVILLFIGGTIGENRFGPQPPPNSGWVIVGALSYILIFPAGVMAAIAIPAYYANMARAQAEEGIQLADGGETPVMEYRRQNQSWPSDLQAVYPAAAKSPAGRFVESVSGNGQGDGYAFTVLMQVGVSSAVAGKTLEVWTMDGGNTWQCGPGAAAPVDVRYLPMSCRETGAP